MSSQTVQNTPVQTKIQLSITGDRILEADIKLIPLSQLKLDPANVRFKHIPEPMADEQIEDWIWKEADTKSLAREIKFSKGLTEKPYVRQIADSQYLIIEGNRRTVCFRKIAEDVGSGKEKTITMNQIDPVQCIVLPKDTEDADIALFLARIHVSGKKDWAALNKGVHVYDLIKKYDYDYDDVAKAISIGKNTISQNVKAYEATLLYHKKYPDDDRWLQRFSHFLELYKKRALKVWADDPTHLEKFMHWISDDKIPMAIHVRKLDKIILESKEAYKAMQKGATIEEAVDIMKQSENRKSFTSSISENVDDQVQDLYQLVHNFPLSKMKEIAKDSDKLKNFETLHEEFGRLIQDIKAVGSE